MAARRLSALVRDVDNLLRSNDQATNETRVETYWRIGERIARERITQEAGYHNSILRDVAAQARVDLRSLQHAVAFHSVYSKPPIKAGLTWTHYRVLLSVPDAAERAACQKLALDQDLSARELAAAIHARLVDGGSATSKLPRPSEPSYLYAATLHGIVDGDTVVLDIDLGFHVFRRQRIRLAALDAKEIDTSQGREARDFVARCLLPARTIVVQTRRADLYGRYVAHLFYSTEELSIADCFAKGRYQNDQLVTSGHARRYR